MTLRFVLLGHPLSHSVSPAIHREAYRGLGLSHHYELRDTPDEAALERAFDDLRRGEIAGANVTIPWKRAALRLADRADAEASRVGAANVLVRDAGGGIGAHNTDVPALAEEILRLAPRPACALVLGNGGAALAAVAAARRAGAAEVAVSARRFTEEPQSDWPGAAELARLGARPLAWPSEAASASSAAMRAFCAEVDIVLQATSAGMRGADPGDEVARVVPWDALPARAVAYDLVYNPAETAFLRAARSRGLEASHGLGMLVGQAALAIEIWLGARPEPAPLHAAARAALGLEPAP